LPIVDGEGLHDVGVHTVEWTPLDASGFQSFGKDGSIVYGVSDGDRSGIWLTKLAPPE
jgi:hypothetical protein